MSVQPITEAGNLPGRAAVRLQRSATGDDGRLLQEVLHLLEAGAPRDLSNLNAVGAPLELGFAWPDGGLRITLDPDPLAAATARRRICLAANVGELTSPQVDLAHRLADWGDRHSIRWGAWLGLRGQGGAVRRKLYLEIPPEAPWRSWEEDLIGAPPVLEPRSVQPVMLGLDGLRGGVEVYARCVGLHPAELDVLLGRVGLAPRGGEVVRMVEALMRRSIRFSLPADDMGFSYALDAGGRALAFTWYATARSLLGPPARAREAILRVGRSAGWDLDAYAALTDAPETPHHGLIGITLLSGGLLQLNVSVAAAQPTADVEA
jgi:hypothetical protein